MAQSNSATQCITSGIPVRIQLLRAANALTRINLLPTEILVQLFQVLVASPRDEDEDDDDEDEDESWQKTKGCVEWLVVTQICHHWYDVAIATPNLWQVIDVYTNVEWLRLCLERSGAVPLAIRFHDMKAVDGAKDLVVRHASRIAKLYVLPRENQSAWCSLHYLRGVPMPLLKEVNVVGGSAIDINGSDHPALEVLRGDGFHVDWKKLPQEQLCVLDLETCTPKPKDRLPSLDAFLHVLGSFQKLEELTLDFSTPFDTFIFGDEKAIAEHWNSSRIVSLPRLRKLSFTSCHSSHHPCDVSSILSHMKLASTTCVSVWMGLEDLEDFHGLRGLLPEDPEAFPFLTRATSACVSHAFKVLIFIVEVDGGTTLSVRYEMAAGGSMKDVYPPDVALSDLCALLSGAPLRLLNIEVNAGAETLMRAFHTFAGLHELVINLHGRKRDFDRFLSAFQADTKHQSGTGVVLSDLRILRLRKMSWKESVLDNIAGCLGTRAVRKAAMLSTLDIEVFPGKGVPDDDELEGMLDDLEPFVDKSWGLMCYNYW